MGQLIPNLPQQLTCSRPLSSSIPKSLFLHNNLSLPFPLIPTPTADPKSTIIRMGGGPRTYPGGVSKWQWKRMQAKKSKQLLKARLCRERQMYEMRKRAELKAAVSELERPWEVVERAPNLFSVKADEQLKVLADRFQKPGGFDMWTDRDGPQLFETPDELPSARFFPKGVVHSVKPYRKINGSEEDLGPVEEVERKGLLGVEDRSDNDGVKVNGRRIDGKLKKNGNGRKVLSKDVNGLDRETSSPLKSVESSLNNGMNGMRIDEGLRKKGNGKKFLTKGVDGSNGFYSERVGSSRKHRARNSIAGSGCGKYNRRTLGHGSSPKDTDSEVYDMGLQQDGSYGFIQKSDQSDYK